MVLSLKTNKRSTEKKGVPRSKTAQLQPETYFGEKAASSKNGAGNTR